MGLKVLMAVSADGYVARGEDDDMSWTGSEDKKVFRLLTHVGTDPIGVGAKTFRQMPPLKGRQLQPISRKRTFFIEHAPLPNPLVDGWPETTSVRRYMIQSKTLEQFFRENLSAWLIGGQTLALSAVRQGLVDQVFLCHNRAMLFGGVPLAQELAGFGRQQAKVEWHGVSVEVRNA